MNRRSINSALLWFSQLVLLLLIIEVRSLQHPQPALTQPKRPTEGQDTASDLRHPSFANDKQPSANPKDSKTDKLLDKLLEPILWVTIAIAGFALWQVRIYRQMRDHAKEIERGYISLNHVPPGLRQQGTSWLFTLQITNSGHTPIDILGGELFWAHTNQPGFQWVEQHRFFRIPPAYVAPGGHLRFINVAVPLTAVAVQAGNGTLWINGVVEYRDRFKDNHQAGYGRRYLPQFADDNLIFDGTTTAGMNYDNALRHEEFGRKYDQWGQPRQQQGQP